MKKNIGKLNSDYYTLHIFNRIIIYKIKENTCGLAITL